MAAHYSNLTEMEYVVARAARRWRPSGCLTVLICAMDDTQTVSVATHLHHAMTAILGVRVLGPHSEPTRFGVEIRITTWAVLAAEPEIAQTCDHLVLVGSSGALDVMIQSVVTLDGLGLSRLSTGATVIVHPDNETVVAETTVPVDTILDLSRPDWLVESCGLCVLLPVDDSPYEGQRDWVTLSIDSRLALLEAAVHIVATASPESLAGTTEAPSALTAVD